MSDEPMTLRELNSFSDVSLRVIWAETCAALGVDQEPPLDRKELTARLFQLSRMLEIKRAKEAKRKLAAEKWHPVDMSDLLATYDHVMIKGCVKPPTKSKTKPKPLPTEDQAAIRAALNSVFDTFPPMPLAGFDQ